jgi:glycosyltransferase involved in cell wall biosynthesis
VRSAVRDGESGILAPADATEALVAGLSALVADADLRARMGAAGREHVTSLYTLDRLTADHAALYDELLTLRRAARQAR